MGEKLLVRKAILAFALTYGNRSRKKTFVSFADTVTRKAFLFAKCVLTIYFYNKGENYDGKRLNNATCFYSNASLRRNRNAYTFGTEKIL